MAWKKLPKNRSPKRVLDAFDLEAEAEGRAISASTSYRPARPTTKRLQNTQRKIDRGDGIQKTRVEKRYVK